MLLTFSFTDSKTLPNIDTSYGNAATARTSSIYLAFMAAWIIGTCHF